MAELESATVKCNSIISSFGAYVTPKPFEMHTGFTKVNQLRRRTHNADHCTYIHAHRVPAPKSLLRILHQTLCHCTEHLTHFFKNYIICQHQSFCLSQTLARNFNFPPPASPRNLSNFRGTVKCFGFRCKFHLSSSRWEGGQANSSKVDPIVALWEKFDKFPGSYTSSAESVGAAV